MFGGSNIEFAKALGEKPNTTSNWVSGNRNIGMDIVEKLIAIIPNLNANWLITGEGEMLKNEETKHSIPIKNSSTTRQFIKDYANGNNLNSIESNILEKNLSELTDNDVNKIAEALHIRVDDLQFGIDLVLSQEKTGKLVPVFNTSMAAGTSTVELSGSREGWVNIGDLLKDSEGGMYVYGNSMIPGYPPGALVGIKRRYESFIEPGNIYVVQTKTNRYVKRLYYNKDKTAFICLSDNHIKHTDGPMEGEYIYPPFEIPFEEVALIWDVTGVIKRNKAIMI